MAQKLLEGVETTLNISYRVDGHGQDPSKIIEINLLGREHTARVSAALNLGSPAIAPALLYLVHPWTRRQLLLHCSTSSIPGLA